MRRFLRIGVAVYVLLSVVLLYRWTYDGNSQHVKTQNPALFGRLGAENMHILTDDIRDTTPFYADDYSGNITTNLTGHWTWRRSNKARLTEMINPSASFCSNRFIGFATNFALLVNATIDPQKGKGRKGGENISEVFNQAEDAEYYQLQRGYFNIECGEDVVYTFRPKTHLNIWLNALQSVRSTKTEHNMTVHSRPWTLAILRHEYANLYHTMTDFYNAFLLAKIFAIDLNNLSILMIDGHPAGALDDTWRTVFGHVVRAGDIQHPVRFSNLIWGIMGYHSLLEQHKSDNVPFLEEFRLMFLTRYGILDRRKLDCNNITVRFLWRRDYLAHPRNPAGVVSRKIANEDELLKTVKTILPNHTVIGEQFDKYPMDVQLRFISNTDILIGMHGAGLAHTLFLPRYAGLIELYPDYWSTANQHFRAMAKWRKLHYLQWENKDRSRELPNKRTIVSVDALGSMVKRMKTRMCP